jgi:NitT/TauT family transport system ATP-binding protein
MAGRIGYQPMSIRGTGDTPNSLAALDPAAAPAAETALFEANGVGFVYDTGTEAVRDVSFRVKRGEIIAIVGPSGCGKSTLLGIIAGLQQVSSGSISWHDRAEEGAEFGHRVGLLFQKDTVLPWRTVLRNVTFGLENFKVPKNERARRANELLRLGELEEFANAYPRVLSGGMRRRVAFLMVMAIQPALLLLDEPFASLDEPTRVGLHAALLKTVYARNTAAILVTHDLGEAISVADRVYVLSARPARVSYVRDIPFGHDRDVTMIRATDEYTEIYQELWAATWRRE